MKRYIFAALLCFTVLSVTSNAVYQVGDAPANECWVDAKGAKVCLYDKRGLVVVMMYSAGWCNPCNQEMREAVPVFEKWYAGQSKPVAFLSLPSAGWDHVAMPDAKFLGEWDAKFGILKSNAPWSVLAAPRDFGYRYFSKQIIPAVVVLDTTGHITWKMVGPDVRDILRQVEVNLP